jgi:hypothetical protein
MQQPGYTGKAISMSRFFVAAIGILVIGVGIAGILIGEMGFVLGGIGLIVSGLAGLLLAIARDGNAPAEASAEVIELFVGDE